MTELYRCGHRRIAALVSGTEDRSISQLRYQGLCPGLGGPRAAPGAGAGHRGRFLRHPAVVSCHAAASAGGGAVHRPCSPSPTTWPSGPCGLCGEAGRRIPEDCSVIAIDGLTVSDYINPPLTTLCQPMEHMGRRSVEILLDMVEHRGGPIRETAHTTLGGIRPRHFLVFPAETA